MGGFSGYINLETIATHLDYTKSAFAKKWVINQDDSSVNVDGFIYNLNSSKNLLAKSSEEETLLQLYENSKESFPNSLRGEFSTVVTTEKSVEIATNHTSSRRVFYIEYDGVMHFHWNLKLLKDSLLSLGFKPRPNPIALRSLLSIGGVFGNQTVIQEIYMLRAGEKLIVTEGKWELNRYYLTNSEKTNLSKAQLIDELQERFVHTTSLQYDHQEVSGFQLISGGLDSRLNLSLAAQNGIQQEAALCFGQTGCRDHWISEQLAKEYSLKHSFVSLESGDYLTAIDENTLAVDGLCFYASSAHFNYALGQTKYISPIIHTGQIGRSIFTEHPFGLWQNVSEYHALLCSSKYADSINNDVKEEMELYDDIDVFYLNNRLYRVISSGNFVAQKVGFIVSPFADPDVQDMAFSAHSEWKKKGMLQWEFMWKHHKNIMKFSQEEYGRPVRSKAEMFLGRVQNKLRNIYFTRVHKDASKLSMNPFDFWWQNNLALQSALDSYFKKNIERTEYDPELREMCASLYNSESLLEKTLSLTVLSVLKNYF